MENLKKYKGITLISLIITIILLLILATITISQLNGKGIFEKAKEARDKWQNAQEDEEMQISQYNNEIEEYIDNVRNSSASYKEDILFSGNETEGTFTFNNNHKLDEYDIIRILYGFEQETDKLKNFQTQTYTIKELNYINDNKSPSQTDVIGLYGYKDLYIEFEYISNTGFKINASNKYNLCMISGIKY